MRKRWTTLGFYLALYLVSAFLTFVFLNAGWPKFSDSSGWARAFASWGFPVWFRLLVGGIEVLGGVLLLVPRTAIYAAAALAAIMVGAMGTHILTGDAAAIYHEAVPLALLGVVMYGHQRRQRAAKAA
jgi:putative oxidoreductase